MELVQRGTFRKDGELLYGKDGVINLDYMESAKFEFGAIPCALKRIIDNYDNYVYGETGIYTKDNDQLIVFANEEYIYDIITEISNFIENPYHLCRYSELEKIPNSSINGPRFDRMLADFWWCIDNGADWMAFLESKGELFEKGMNDTCNYWLQKKSENEANEKSLRK